MTNEQIREHLLKAGVKNLKEFGYTEVTTETILTDEVYKELERKYKKEQKINKPIFDPLSHSTTMLINKIRLSDGSKEDLEKIFREVGYLDE